MTILAIDPAEKTGWAVNTEPKPSYGLWDFKLKRDESFAIKLIKFEHEFITKIKEYNVGMVVFERPSGINSSALMSHSKFIAMMEVYCTKNNIPYRGYSASEIKKFATGKGNSPKIEMIRAAIRKFGYRGNDDNVADALCILNLAKTEFKNAL